MKTITLDFESPWDTDYTLKRMRTEDYVSDPRFEVICVSAKINDAPTLSFSGTMAETKEWLYQFDIRGSALCAHKTMFDGLILAYHFDLYPAFYCCTMSMAQVLYSHLLRSVSLDSVTKHLKLGTKGDEVMTFKGFRRADFTPEQLAQYMRYCANDVDLERAAFNVMRPKLHPDKLRGIDMTLRMYMQPSLELDVPVFKANLFAVQKQKADILRELDEVGITPDVLRSNVKFAEVLRSKGIEPPMKPSLASIKKGDNPVKMTYAFAKEDPEFIELREEFEDDIEMTMLLNGRISEKSTQEETRTQKFIEIGERHRWLRVPLNYAKAHTMRYGGTEGINMQNPPKITKSRMRFGIVAPPGHSLIVSDLSQIEARIAALLAGQDDLVQIFAEGGDPYSVYASDLFHKEVTKRLAAIDKEVERMRKVGKESILGLGYGMGPPKFQRALKGKAGLTVDLGTVTEYVQFYRRKYEMIPLLWNRFEAAFKHLLFYKEAVQIGPVRVEYADGVAGITGPNGTRLWYPRLKLKDGQFTYQAPRHKHPIGVWGGFWLENTCQFLANIVIEQGALRVRKELELDLKLQAHDAGGWVVPTSLAQEYGVKIERCLSTRPEWWPELPIAADTKIGKNYGET